MLSTAYYHQGPSAVRYPRGNGPGATIQAALTGLEIGRAEIRRQGKKVAILSFGSMLNISLQAADQCDATVVNMRFIKPLDQAMIAQIAKTHEIVITVEENTLLGGAGSAVLESLQALNFAGKTYSVGLPDTFIEHGSHEQMLTECGLSAEGILAVIKKLT